MSQHNSPLLPDRGWSFRRAEPNDAHAIAALVHDAYVVYLPRIGRWPQPATLDYTQVLAASEVWVAVARRSIIGVLVLTSRRGALLIENVAVSPEHQRKGLGRSLLRLADRRARDAGVSVVELYTNEQMTENIRLYERLGFTETERRTVDGFNRVFFRKRLPGPVARRSGR